MRSASRDRSLDAGKSALALVVHWGVCGRCLTCSVPPLPRSTVPTPRAAASTAPPRSGRAAGTLLEPSGSAARRRCRRAISRRARGPCCRWAKCATRSGGVVRKNHYQCGYDRCMVSIRVVGCVGRGSYTQWARAKRERRAIVVRSVRWARERADRVPVSDSAELEHVNCGMGRT